MLDTVKINHVQHISFTQSRLTDAVSVILSELLSYEHPPKAREAFFTLYKCKGTTFYLLMHSLSSCTVMWAVSPSFRSPLSICSATVSSTLFWMARRRGLAP